MNLRFLDLSDNQLKSVPEEIDRLQNLETLMLYINQIERLPESIGSLSNLDTLWIGKNQLRTLPRGFTKLKKLEWGNRYISPILDENPLQNPPLEIAKLGPEAVGRFFNTRVPHRAKSSKPTKPSADN